MHPRICQYPPRTLQKLLSRLHKDASTLCLQRSLGQGGRVSAHGLGRGLGGGVGRGPPTPWPKNFWSENVGVTQIRRPPSGGSQACGTYALSPSLPHGHAIFPPLTPPGEAQLSIPGGGRGAAPGVPSGPGPAGGVWGHSGVVQDTPAPDFPPDS